MIEVIRDKKGAPIKVGEFKIHTQANMVPMASDLEQAALQDSIERNGQREKITLYRDHIVDGRCRALACANLDIEVTTTTIPWKTPLTEVEELVSDLNIRRNLNTAQKAIVALRAYNSVEGVKQADICKKWGVNRNSFSAAVFLDTNAPFELGQMFDGMRIYIGKDKHGNPKMTDSIQAVQKYIKRKQEAMKADPVNPIGTKGFNDQSLLITQAEKDWYANAMNSCGGFDTRFFDSRIVSDLLISIAHKNTH